MSVVLSMTSNQNAEEVAHFLKKSPIRQYTLSPLGRFLIRLTIEVPKYKHLLIHLIGAIMFSEVAASIVHMLRSVLIGEGDHQVPETRRLPEVCQVAVVLCRRARRLGRDSR
ncbi:hypothetical protein PILCRDRAFT_829037 [Piloderma croceum F 1598]|uniref:Uncharacterized protein n=1 Tax=Piloderma croceum (strain F 1598) TaxID=765440 RepID=A0A0C3F069_PILCF|nr:hypothetical protein PILCRDRAFT_829037 [Piloderma croceum F 1598]